MLSISPVLGSFTASSSLQFSLLLAIPLPCRSIPRLLCVLLLFAFFYHCSTQFSFTCCHIMLLRALEKMLAHSLAWVRGPSRTTTNVTVDELLQVQLQKVRHNFDLNIGFAITESSI